MIKILNLINIRFFITTVFLLLYGLAAHSKFLISLLLGDKLNSDQIEYGNDRGFNWSQSENLDSNPSYKSFNLRIYLDILVDNSWSF